MRNVFHFYLSKEKEQNWNMFKIILKQIFLSYWSENKKNTPSFGKFDPSKYNIPSFEKTFPLKQQKCLFIDNYWKVLDNTVKMLMLKILYNHPNAIYGLQSTGRKENWIEWH